MKAFPTEHPIAGTMSHHADGMDLRDYFAAKAMQAIITAQAFPTGIMIDTAKEAYQVADAMMEARELNKKELA